MGLLELQFRKESFIAYFIAEFNSRRLPFPSSNFFLLPPAVRGAPLEQIECEGATIDPTSGEDRIVVQADIALRYHQNLAEVRAAGSMNPAPTHEQRIPLAFTVAAQIVTKSDGSKAVTLQVSLPLGLLPAKAITLPLPPDVNAAVVAVVASNNIVAVRIGTQPSASVTDPITDHLGPDEWSQLVSGSVLADLLTTNLQSTIEKAATGDIEIGSNASGGWYPPHAIATAELVKVDACIFDIDISVDLTLTASFTLAGPSLTTKLRLSWEVDSTLCDVIGGLIFGFFAGFIIDAIAEDKASDAVLGTSGGAPGFKEVARDDDSITYERQTFFGLGGSLFQMTHSEVTNDGLHFGGRLRLRPRLGGLQGSVDQPSSGLKTDCHTRSVDVEFRHGQVLLRDVGLDGAPTLFPDWTPDGRNARFDPPNAWVAVPQPGNSWLDLVVRFDDPPGGRLPAGTATSVFLFTDVGVRWIDLGTIPVPHPQPTLADMAVMFSICMAKERAWTARFIEVRWLPRPPEPVEIFDPVRLWTLGLQGIPAVATIDILAVRADGTTRQLQRLAGVSNTAVRLTTAADETLRLISDIAFEAPAPVVEQRWITPYATIPEISDAVSVAVLDDQLAVRGRDGNLANVTLDAADANRTVLSLDRATAQQTSTSGRDQDRSPLLRNTAKLDRNTIAVIHDGVVLLGTLGPQSQLQ